MTAKTKFSRDELLIADRWYACFGKYVECCLCRARGWKDEIVHEPDCVLRDDAVESIEVVGVQ